MFMTNTATTDFTICQRRARQEFIVLHSSLNNTQKFKLTSQQNEFLDWLKQKTTLKKLRYVDNTSDKDELKSACKNAVSRFKRLLFKFTIFMPNGPSYLKRTTSLIQTSLQIKSLVLLQKLIAPLQHFMNFLSKCSSRQKPKTAPSLSSNNKLTTSS